MTATYTPGSSAAKDRVRLLIPDRTMTAPLLQDEEIADLLITEGDNIKRAAALALELIAADESLVQKVIRLADGTATDGTKVTMALLARAKLLREQADLDDDTAEGGAFDVAEQVVDAFSARERLRKQFLRGAL